MEKLWLIIKREYWSRVTKKSFLLGTILTPLGIGALVFLNIKLATYKDDNFKKIIVRDESGILKEKGLQDQKNITFKISDAPLDSLKAWVQKGYFNGALVIPNITDFTKKKMTVQYFSDDKLGNDMTDDIEDKIAEGIKQYKISALQLDTNKIAQLATRIEIDPEPIAGKENASSMTGMIAMFVGIMFGVFMYMSVFIYGMMIFRSVMEEKTTRIVEVMISSVRPFQLMMGKIIGVGGVGFTQMIIWFVLGSGIITAVTTMTGAKSANPQMGTMNPEAQKAMQDAASNGSAKFMAELASLNWGMMLPAFIIFFILGYFLYSSLFAAVGSAVGDDTGEAQSLTLPISIPVIIAVYIMITAVRAPESSLAVWASLFPLFSPIVMPARLPFNPPLWQVLLSIALLIGTVIFFVWLAGRIYRVGILMYGKKVTIKEIAKWIFVK